MVVKYMNIVINSQDSEKSQLVIDEPVDFAYGKCGAHFNRTTVNVNVLAPVSCTKLKRKVKGTYGLSTDRSAFGVLKNLISIHKTSQEVKK